MKMGKVSSEIGDNYEMYCLELERVFPGPEFSIVRSPTHIGFAMAVKLGIQLCQTEFAVIMQHDRSFKKDVDGLGVMLDTMVRMFIRRDTNYISFSI
jgi:hypothetical protein